MEEGRDGGRERRKVEGRQGWKDGGRERERDKGRWEKTKKGGIDEQREQ